MTTPVQPVTVRFFDQDGQPMAVRVSFKLTVQETYQGLIVAAGPDYVTTDAATGLGVINLFPNALGANSSQYTVKAVDVATGKKVLESLCTIPNSPCYLDQILNQEPPPDIDAATQALAGAQGALALATVQADLATAKAVLTAADVVLTHADALASGVNAANASMSEGNAADSAAAALASQTDIYTNWQVKLDAADASAVAALASQTAAGVSETNSGVSAGTATTARIAAEAARDAALIQAGVYVDEPTGRAAVADGVAFKVQGSGDVAAYEYRRVSAGVVSTLIATYPSKAAVDTVRADFLAVGKNKITNATFEKQELNVVGDLYDGYWIRGYLHGAGGASMAKCVYSVVPKACALTRSNRALQLQHSSTAVAGTDFQLYQTVDIPAELQGDTTATGRFIFCVQHEVAGTTSHVQSIQLLDASDAVLSNATVTKLSTDGAVGAWYFHANSFAITNALARKIKVGIRTTAAVGPTLTGKTWIGGVFLGFNSNQLTFDVNGAEIRAAEINVTEPIATPWVLGSNKITDPLLLTETLGEVALFKNFTVSTGGGVVAAATSIETFSTPFGSTKAIRLSHYKTGSTRTGRNVFKTVAVPAHLLGTVNLPVTVSCGFYLNSAHVSVFPQIVCFNAAGAAIENPAVVMKTPDAAITGTAETGVWKQVAATFKIVSPLVASFTVNFSSSVSTTAPDVPVGYTYMSGFFCDFNRPLALGYDRNLNEEISVAVTSNEETAPWKRGANPVVNPLFTTDALGYTGVPTGYTSGFGGMIGGSYGVFPAVEIATKNTPFNTSKALKVTLFYNATNYADAQLYQIIDVPSQFIGGSSVTAYLTFSVFSTTPNANVTAVFYGKNAAEADVQSFLAVAIPLSAFADSWKTVTFPFTFTDTSIVKLRVAVRLSAKTDSGYFTDAPAYLSGVRLGFNNPNQIAFDRNLNYEADMLAKARVDALRAELSSITPRNLVGSFDQYTDARGNILPILPTAVISCFGDSLTSGGYPTKLAALFTTTPRTIKDYGIGGDRTYEIIARVKGHDANTAGVTWTPGTIRLKTKRVVPPREIDEFYRASWSQFGLTIAEPKKVEFFNSAGLIGATRLQMKAVATVSGTTLTSAGHPWVNGDEVYHLGTLPSGMYTGKVYYVRDVAANTYSLAEFSGGAAVSFGSGSVTSLGPFYLDWAYTSQDHTISTITHTDADMDTVVLWMGANNIAETQTVKDHIVATFNHFKALAKRVLVMTVLPNESYLPATAAGISLANVNAWILAEFPDNSADALGYLKSKYNPALPQDVTDVANNITPTSLRVDAIHLTNAGSQHIADLVYAFFNARGW